MELAENHLDVEGQASFNDFLEHLRTFEALRDSGSAEKHDLVLTASTAPQPPTFASDDEMQTLSPKLVKALREMGINSLYEHQYRAIEAISSGKDVVISTPTASGKTLGFNIPVVEHLLTHPSARVLMVHPMKALANDQMFQLNSLLKGVGVAEIECWVLDGDTPSDDRRILKANPPSVLYTNPEMLHMSLLAWWDHWVPFLSKVSHIVIDEIHEYRGFFGTNMAFLLRRLLRKLSELGVNPQIISASATCSNPGDHAKHLTGRYTRTVTTTTQIKPTRHFAFITPEIEDFRFHQIYIYRIALAACACLDKDKSVLVFCPTRKFCEEATLSAKREALKRGLDPEAVVPYRSGYTAEDRRRIEEGMRDGTYKVVFSTNALEIGIDIGGLDACILAGFPDNIMSAWQRIGRVGRSWKQQAYVLFYALNNPYDRFMAQNLEMFLHKPLDELTVGLENEELIDKHIPCLLYERKDPLRDEDEFTLGELFCSKALLRQAEFKPLKGRNSYKPHPGVPIRGVFGGEYKLMYHGKEIGTVSEQQRHQEAYLGAIYNHFGKSYKVRAHGEKEIELEEAEPGRRTEPLIYTVPTILEIFSGVRFDEDVAWYHGKVRIYNNFTGYKVEDESSGAILDTVMLASPVAITRDVHAAWVSLEGATGERPAGIELFEQMLRIAAPFVVPCDRFDISSLCVSGNPPQVFIHENVPGGMGIAKSLLAIHVKVIQQGLDIATQCDCEYGCPKCINVSRRQKLDNRIPKLFAVELGSAILNVEANGSKETFDKSMHSWVKEKRPSWQA